MTKYNKFYHYKNVYDNAIKNIKKYQKDPDMKNITNFLLETDINPYSFLPSVFAVQLDTAEGFSNLLDQISYALVEDICFPILDGKPYIAFCHSDEFKPEFILDKLSLNQFNTSNREIIFLNTLDEFITECINNHIRELKKWFTNDVRRFGLKTAISYYKHYQHFDNEWTKEYAS